MSRESPIRTCRVQIRKDSLDRAHDNERRTEYGERLGALGMVVGQQKAQRNLREPAQLRQRSIGALDAIHDGADDQRQKRPGNPHPDLRHHANDHFALVPAHVGEQAHELRPSGDTLLRCLDGGTCESLCRCAHLRMDCGVSSAGASLKKFLHESSRAIGSVSLSHSTEQPRYALPAHPCRTLLRQHHFPPA